jgi:hypothetical protein
MFIFLAVALDQTVQITAVLTNALRFRNTVNKITRRPKDKQSKKNSNEETIIVNTKCK